MQILWVLLTGKGQWMITTRSRLWILSPGKVLFRTGLLTCVLLLLTYSICLGVRVRQADAAVARVGTVANLYADRNADQVERRKQVFLLSNTLAKGLDSSGMGDVKSPKAWVLKTPYPSVAGIQRHLGAADESLADSTGTRLVWNQKSWRKPGGWPASGFKEWPCAQSKIAEAWFDKAGSLTKLVVFRQDSDRRATESIGRTPADWSVSR
jgi:hypothetical protein